VCLLTFPGLISGLFQNLEPCNSVKDRENANRAIYLVLFGSKDDFSYEKSSENNLVAGGGV